MARTNISPVTLKLPDGKTYTSNEKVSMSLRVHSIQGPKTLKLSDVIFVPTLNQCLISVRQFCMDGYLISFSGDRCRIYTPERKSIDFVRLPTDTLYRMAIIDENLNPKSTKIDVRNDGLNISKMEEIPNLEIPDISRPIDDLKASDTVRDILKSHLIFGHIGARALNALMKAKIVTSHRASLVNQVVANCASCRLNKMKANPVPGETMSSAPYPCHSIHCDEVTGLPATPSGFTGFSLIVNRKTKFIDIRLIRAKNEAVEHIKEFVNTAETYDLKVRVLRTDSAPMYANDKSFIGWLKSKGIRQELSAPHSQYQNGFVEHHIQTLRNMSATALHTSGLPKSYWAEALLWAKYSWNCIPRWDNENLTPYKAVTGRDIELSQLHPFGCRVFVKSMENPDSKFDPKAEDFIFLNYDPRAKAFRVRSKETSRVLVRSQRDLSFNDLEFPAWKNFNVKRDLGISFDISLYKVPSTQRPQQVVISDRKEEEKRPETPPIILDENRHHESSGSGPSYTSEFQRDITLNPRSGTRSGRRYSSNDILISFIEELSSDQLAFHNENESCNEIAVDKEVGRHIESMTEKVTPTDIRSAMEIPDFKKAINEELKTINDFHTFDLVPRMSSQRV